MIVDRAATSQGFPFRSSVLYRSDDTSSSADCTDSVSLGSYDSSKPATEKEWTIIHYSAADNKDLKKNMLENFNDIEHVGSDDRMNIVAQLDQGNGDCKRFLVQRDEDYSKINSTVLQDLGDTNMSDPKQLADFIEFAMKKFPAKHYAVVISDHGKGWEGGINDEGSKGWMTTPQMREAFEQVKANTGNKIDLLGFDACLMGSTEVAYELKDAANYLVASEETEYFGGWPYGKILNSETLSMLSQTLHSKTDVCPAEFANKIVDTTTGDPNIPTMSAIDMSKMPALASRTKGFADQLLNTDTPVQVLRDIARETQRFSYVGDLKDYYDFCNNITKSDKITDEKLKSEAKGVMGALKDAVINEQHHVCCDIEDHQKAAAGEEAADEKVDKGTGDHENEKFSGANGLNIAIFSYNYDKKKYGNLLFSKDSGWDNVAKKLQKNRNRPETMA